LLLPDSHSALSLWILQNRTPLLYRPFYYLSKLCNSPEINTLQPLSLQFHFCATLHHLDVWLKSGNRTARKLPLSSSITFPFNFLFYYFFLPISLSSFKGLKQTE
jgi:hypothetical protein